MQANVERIYLAAARYGVLYGGGSVAAVYLSSRSKMAVLVVGAVGLLVGGVGAGTGAGNTFSADVHGGMFTSHEQDPEFVASGNTPSEVKLLLFSFGVLVAVGMVFAFTG